VCVCVCVSVCVWQCVQVGGWVCVAVCPGGWVFKLGVIVVLNTMSQPTDFGFKRARVRVRV